jgi:hypothetical protein
MTPDFDTYLMDAYDRWCECEYDTEDEGDWYVPEPEYDEEEACEPEPMRADVAEALRLILGK